jgi:hemolysin D
MKLYFAAWKDLISRYVTIWRGVWGKRHLLSLPPRPVSEREFLPAALEVEETPVSPLPRVAMGLIVSFALIALVWAVIGKLDVVVTAGGKIVPNERTKVIQPIETATVKAIYVQDGQQVKAGDILLELDATSADADERRTEGDWMGSRLACARALAMLSVLDHPEGHETPLKIPETRSVLRGIPPERVAAEERVLVSQAEEYRKKLEKMDAEISQREAEIVSNRAVLSKIQETLPIVQERAREYKKLFDQNYTSKHEYLDKEKERIELEHGLTAQTGKITELESALLESRRGKESLLAETRRSARETLSENEHRSMNSNQERIKATQRVSLLTLKAPVSGKVQQLSVHTVGGVVTPAQPILAIVPTTGTVEIEAFIQNKDVGFVSEGQDAVIKVEAFPSTKYGTIPGRVKIISMDAVTDEKKGLVYSTRVEMLKNSIPVGHTSIPLTPGMSVSVEIKTGRRRVIEYFLSPLMEHADESLKER